jgi:hypothetical protein
VFLLLIAAAIAVLAAAMQAALRRQADEIISSRVARRAEEEAFHSVVQKLRDSETRDLPLSAGITASAQEIAPGSAARILLKEKYISSESVQLPYWTAAEHISNHFSACPAERHPSAEIGSSAFRCSETVFTVDRNISISGNLQADSCEFSSSSAQILLLTVHGALTSRELAVRALPENALLVVLATGRIRLSKITIPEESRAAGILLISTLNEIELAQAADELPLCSPATGRAPGIRLESATGIRLNGRKQQRNSLGCPLALPDDLQTAFLIVGHRKF